MRFFFKLVRPARRLRKPNKRFLDNKERARKLILERLDYFNKFYGFNWHRVAVKNTKRRWGSCSKKGNLNFCYKLVFLPSQLADYVIVHELCHLEQFNHSRAFWELVAKTIPNHKSLQNELKNAKL